MNLALRHVDLCSGIGGFALGFERAGLSSPVLFCDVEQWSRRVLAKHWPDVPISEDVKVLANDPEKLVPDCDILTAGYPCQPFSFAGKRQGEADDRHIWPYIRRIVSFKRPTWCVFENVYGHVSMGLDQVLLDLESEGYAARTFIVPACGVDAPHRRNRLWIIAKHSDPDVSGDVGYADSGDISRHNKATEQGWGQQGLAAGCEDVADATSQRQQGQGAQGDASNPAPRGKGQTVEFINGGVGDKRVSQSRMGRISDGVSTWLDEPRDTPRVATGVKQRSERLKGLGNAIVPQIAEQIGLTIKAERERAKI